MAPDTGERVSQANAICPTCSGTGTHPGTNSGEKCGACKGFGRLGALSTDHPDFVDVGTKSAEEKAKDALALREASRIADAGLPTGDRVGGTHVTQADGSRLWVPDGTGEERTGGRHVTQADGSRLWVPDEPALNPDPSRPRRR